MQQATKQTEKPPFYSILFCTFDYILYCIVLSAMSTKPVLIMSIIICFVFLFLTSKLLEETERKWWLSEANEVMSSAHSLTCFKQFNWLLNKKKEQLRKNVDHFPRLETVMKHLHCIKILSGKRTRKYLRFRREGQKNDKAVSKLRIFAWKSHWTPKNGIRDSPRWV